MERGAKSAKAKVEARPTVTRKPRKVETSTGLQFKQRLAEALEQHAAISEILRVISSSPGDVKPVLATIAERAAHLCDASFAQVLLVEGNVLRPTVAYWADAGSDEEYDDSRGVKRTWPLTRSIMSGRAVLDCETIHHADVVPLLDSEYPDSRAKQQELGFRAVLLVPLMREGGASGVIFIFRREPRPFSPEQVALVQTFAGQAAIVIENVHLFKETKEALEQQTATSEILRVISRSPTDVQPVFDTIVAAARKLCGASSANVVTFDGKLIHLAAFVNVNPEYVEGMHQLFPRPPSRATGVTRAVLTRSVITIPDVLEDREYASAAPRLVANARAGGFRSVLAVPLMRDGSPIGAIAVGRPEPGTFPEKQIALLQTFADQAVIAIENVRLFTELKARTAELTRSVGELKALGEVGRAVTSTLDLETVLSTIVSRATQLAGMDGGSIWEYDEARAQFYLHATDRLPDDLVEVLRATPIRKGEGALGRLAMTGAPVEIRDIADERSYQSRVRELLIRSGYRSVLAVPLLREDRLLGALAVNRNNAGEFAPEVVELLKTFATQSALAIQNARLFREIEIKSRQLEIASQHKSEFLANMSHELRTPLNAIIGFSEVLAERMFGEINAKQAEYLSDILESGRHLLSLINDILDLSKIEAGRMELEPTDFDLPAAIENALILVRERAQRHGITLGRMVDGRLGMIRADERKVKQVLLNLLSNALKFTPDGGTVDVLADVNDGEAKIMVRDTGVGIAPEDQKAVFEEFRQVGTASKKVEGTGLGLTISRKFIELHGGRIWVESQLGLGSTFAFTLPLTIDQPHKDLLAHAAANQPR
jgi:signal transduction histidine kinase